MRRLSVTFGLVLVAVVARGTEPGPSARGLVGYWPLKGDCRDHSGNGLHGRAHRVNLDVGDFNGRDAYVEVPDAPALRLGTSDFTLSAWIRPRIPSEDAPGDIVGKFDPVRRKGFNLSLTTSAAGYNGTGDARHLFFGTDDGTPGKWTDCGRPGGVTHNSDALTVFDGHLYAGVTDAPRQEDWAHVYRYDGGQRWIDCGRVGAGRTRGVYALVVHDGALHAATSASHGPQPKSMDFGRVYRYRGGKGWEDLGQPGANYRLNCLASFRGKLYACGFNIGPGPGHCYVYEGNKQWRVCGTFDGWPHTLAVHDGKLYTAYPKGEVFAYDGATWENLGNPFGSRDECNQIHSLGVYRGELYAGTWPKGKVAVLRHGKWMDRGRPGDATEVIALTVYNGGLYAGTIPRAEVFRLDGDRWTSLRRLFDPESFTPVPVGSRDAKGVADWSRATSLAVYGGKLFASTGTCYRTMIEPPRPDEIRGNVYSLETGSCVSSDRALGPGWNQFTAIRRGPELKLYVNGRLTAASGDGQQTLDLSNDAALRIGFGQQAHFNGKIREVRLYNRALGEEEVQSLCRGRETPDGSE